jgi:hypothetical protein
MNDGTVKISNGGAFSHGEVIIAKPRLHGFMAFQRMEMGSVWMQVYPVYGIGVSSPACCPSPMFQTKAAIVEQVKNNQYITGEVKIFELSE